MVVAQLAPLPLGRRLDVWQRLLVRLRADVQQGVVRPPARLTELLRRWVIEVDVSAAEERRRRAERDRRVDYRRRDDGLVDLFLVGLRAPDAQAVLQRIRRGAEPSGPDDRTADQRRLDAARDLLLGRCGSQACLPGSPAPCGVDVQVHVTLGAALGTTHEPAELLGHGAVEPDLLQAILSSAPRLTPVFADRGGTPVGVGRSVAPLVAHDPVALRLALLEVAQQVPRDELHPRHPDDHRGHAGHPDGQAGGYRVPRRLRRLLFARAARCDFPGCGARAELCDAEHDVAWPDGPTCACNLGPCCRRHHRVKQEGWSKQRGGSGVRWTSPTGRTTLSPAQHEAPRDDVRPLPSVPVLPDEQGSATELDEELWRLLDRPDDPEGLELREEDRDPLEDVDVVGRRLEEQATRWTLDLDDPYAWHEAEGLLEVPGPVSAGRP